MCSQRLIVDIFGSRILDGLRFSARKNPCAVVREGHGRFPTRTSNFISLHAISDSLRVDAKTSWSFISFFHPLRGRASGGMPLKVTYESCFPEGQVGI